MRTRIIAVLLTVAVVFCTLVFSAAAEDETCDIYVSINGSGTVTVNDVERDESFSSSFSVGDSVTLTATADDGYEFLYWTNIENSTFGRIVSWEPELTFDAVTYARYEAVFDKLEDVSSAVEKHTIVYLGLGEKVLSFQQNVAMEYTGFYNSVPTSGMKVSGRTWNGWDQTVDQVAATDGRVYVRPLYSTDATFTITWTVNGVTTTRTEKYLDETRVTAPSTLDGESFSYWIARAKDVNSVDEIASFYANYNFIVTGDVTLEAIYGEPYPQGNPGVAIRVAGDFASKEEKTLTIIQEHSVVSGFTVTENGLLLTKNDQIGSFSDRFVIDPNNSEIVKGKSKVNTLYGNYRANIDNWTPVDMGSYTYYPRIYARAYVIVRDTNGNIATYYSDPYCVEYNYDTGSSGGDNNDDPFG